MWFSYYTPCATQYELKYCRRTLAKSTVSAVERSCNAASGSAFARDNATKALTEAAKKHIRKVAYRMASDQKIWVIRIMAFLVTKVLGWLYGNDVYIDEESVQEVRTLQKTHTIIYAPTHKSHLDSVLMGYTSFAYGLEPPHIVAGDNLQLPLISFLMRGSGAFFIRRTNKFGADRELYKKTLAGELVSS